MLVRFSLQTQLNDAELSRHRGEPLRNSQWRPDSIVIGATRGPYKVNFAGLPAAVELQNNFIAYFGTKTLSNVTLGIFNNEKLEFWRGSAGVTLRF